MGLSTSLSFFSRLSKLSFLRIKCKVLYTGAICLLFSGWGSFGLGKLLGLHLLHSNFFKMTADRLIQNFVEVGLLFDLCFWRCPSRAL